MAFKCSDLGETRVIPTHNSLARTHATIEGPLRSDPTMRPEKREWERVSKRHS